MISKYIIMNDKNYHQESKGMGKFDSGIILKGKTGTLIHFMHKITRLSELYLIMMCIVVGRMPMQGRVDARVTAVDQIYFPGFSVVHETRFWKRRSISQKKRRRTMYVNGILSNGVIR